MSVRVNEYKRAYVLVRPYARSSMSSSSSVGVEGSRAKSSARKITWHVEHDSVPSHAPARWAALDIRVAQVHMHG